MYSRLALKHTMPCATRSSLSLTEWISPVASSWMSKWTNLTGYWRTSCRRWGHWAAQGGVSGALWCVCIGTAVWREYLCSASTIMLCVCFSGGFSVRMNPISTLSLTSLLHLVDQFKSLLFRQASRLLWLVSYASSKSNETLVLNSNFFFLNAAAMYQKIGKFQLSIYNLFLHRVKTQMKMMLIKFFPHWRGSRLSISKASLSHLSDYYEVFLSNRWSFLGNVLLF